LAALSVCDELPFLRHELHKNADRRIGMGQAACMPPVMWRKSVLRRRQPLATAATATVRQDSDICPRFSLLFSIYIVGIGDFLFVLPMINCDIDTRKFCVLPHNS
jgi:hypothetical protein